MLLKGSENPDTISISPEYYCDNFHRLEHEGDDGMDTRKHDPSEVKKDLEVLLQNAVDIGLPTKYHNDMRNLVEEYENIFRARTGSDPPANIDPMQIRLKEVSKTV